MKIRNGFVSNSSSSSFVINRSDLTQEQIGQIACHSESETWKKGDCGTYDEWEITITEDMVKGKTSLDNFDMHAFLEDELKIDPSKID